MTPLGSWAILVAAAFAVVAGAAAGEPPRALPPFLDTFRAARETPVVGRDVGVLTAAGERAAYLARPATSERLPAVLLIPEADGLTAWLKQTARELASVGYVVLAAEPAAGRGDAVGDELALVTAWAGLRRLRGRADVLPDQVGVVGWGPGGRTAMALAGAARVQACVVCGPPPADAPALAATLHGTPFLGVFPGAEGATRRGLPALRQAFTGSVHALRVHDGVRSGFMGPPDRATYVHEAAERAWVEVYEFLGKHVEDAPAPGPAPAAPPRTVATIADVMRAVNGPTGVRGRLAEALRTPPADRRGWAAVRSDAAVVAETGAWLAARRPPRGSAAGWAEQARAFTAAAEQVVAAADRQDYAGTRAALERLTARCAACHRHHR